MSVSDRKGQDVIESEYLIIFVVFYIVGYMRLKNLIQNRADKIENSVLSLLIRGQSLWN